MATEEPLLEQSEPQETTALLQSSRPTRTPLPWGQLFILFWVQLAEPLTSQVIYPFINKQVSELPITGGDEAKMGYYAGLIESAFSLTQALTVWYWSRLSDRIGRKPVILVGLLGLTISTAFFGVSTTFEGLIISRCLSGALNGNAGAIKSMMGEITDETNVAQAIALLPVIWNTGATVGPIIGGWLSNPHEHFPTLFSGTFWKRYPYALPCFCVALYCAGTLLIAFLYLEESMKYHNSGNTEPGVEAGHPQQLPLSKVLTPRVRIVVLSYTFLAFLDIAIRALQPLFLTASPSFGGLGFSVPAVGTCLALFFVASGVYQALAFAPIYEWMGPKRIYVVGMCMFIPIFVLFPMMRASLGENTESMHAITWFELILQILLYVVMDMAFSSAIIYIRGSAPNIYSLGVTNGLAQTAASISRAIGPVSATSMFAFSVELSHSNVNWWPGGNLVYVVFVLISLIAVFVANRLPEKPFVKEIDTLGDEGS